MKAFFGILLTLLITCQASSKTPSLFEVGIGVEYGGFGAQIKMPIDTKSFEIYGALGIFGYSNSTGEELGAGVGFNYFLDKKNALSVYGGVINVQKYTDDFLNIESKRNLGASIAYKYYFDGKDKTGFGVGVSYNVYSDDSYPFFSLSYRY